MLTVNTHQTVFITNTGLFIVSVGNYLLLKADFEGRNEKNACMGVPDFHEGGNLNRRRLSTGIGSLESSYRGFVRKQHFHLRGTTK